VRAGERPLVAEQLLSSRVSGSAAQFSVRTGSRRVLWGRPGPAFAGAAFALIRTGRLCGDARQDLEQLAHLGLGDIFS